ncbi:MAG: amino acid racemase [Bowdeniella nasicola]|nr:amino acid racemase [Bowdeniella nasicola]
MSSKLVGILGGMGPAATADFYSTLVSLTPAATDQEHLRVVMWADPSVPNRQDAILRGGTDPSPWLRAGAEKLVAAGAQIIVVPCNTVHAFLPPVMADLPVTFIDIRTATAAALPTGRVALLATDGALQAEIFAPLETTEREIIKPPPSDQALLMDVVFALKAGTPVGELANRFAPVLRRLAARGASTAVVGCTELSVILTNDDAPLRLVDPAVELARATIAAARSEV